MSKKKPLSAEPRKAPKQDRSRQTYQVILFGAIRVIQRDGIKKFSTNKVAEESGVSIGSLYQYFPSKEAIIAALIDQNFQIQFAYIKSRLESFSADKGLRAILRDILSIYFDIDPDEFVFRRTLVELVAAVGKTDDALRFHRAVAELLIENLRTKFKCGPQRAHYETAVFMMTYSMRATALCSVDENIKSLNRDDLMNEIARVLAYVLDIPDSEA